MTDASVSASVAVFNGTPQMLNAALAGFGLAYVPEDLAQPHLAKGRQAGA
jgi:DNA-binding transcriptional LysR family regulator